MFMMRFDMRAPSTGAPATEHHASDDGFLPSPLMLAGALAARTTSLPITVAVVILPLYEPVRLAEEMAVLDIISPYREAARAAGHEPGMCVLMPADTPTTVFVAEDVDRAWEELGPYLMHDVLSYASWNEGVTGTASLSAARTAEELRAENRSHRILSVEQAIASVRAGAPLALHPLVGGLPPETAWRYLRTVADSVLPALP